MKYRQEYLYIYIYRPYGISRFSNYRANWTCRLPWTTYPIFFRILYNIPKGALWGYLSFLTWQLSSTPQHIHELLLAAKGLATWTRATITENSIRIQSQIQINHNSKPNINHLGSTIKHKSIGIKNQS